MISSLFVKADDVRIHGRVAPGYEEVEQVFRENFKKGLEKDRFRKFSVSDFVLISP